MKSETKKIYFQVGLFMVLVFFWWSAPIIGIADKLFISSPPEVLLSLKKLLFSKDFWDDFWASIVCLMTGISAAIFFGILAGVSIGKSTLFLKILEPYIFALNSLPKIAIMPLLILWLGVGPVSKIAIVFLMAVMPILISTIEGVRNIDKNIFSMAKNFEIGRGRSYFLILFFGSLPHIFSGMKISIGRAMVGIVAAELFGYGRGIGYLLRYYSTTFQTGYMMAVLAVLILISIILTKAVLHLEKIIIKWE